MTLGYCTSPASHLPSVGCFRISCWDLAPAWLNTDVHEKGWWIEPPSQLESCSCRWLLLLAYGWGLCAMPMKIYVLKAHLLWEAPVGMRTRIPLTVNIREALGGIEV